jgi:hypothetical protein
VGEKRITVKPSEIVQLKNALVRSTYYVKKYMCSLVVPDFFGHRTAHAPEFDFRLRAGIFLLCHHVHMNILYRIKTTIFLRANRPQRKVKRLPPVS